LAKKSVGLCCHTCGKVAELLPELKEKEEGDDEAGDETAVTKKKPTRFEKEIEQLRLAQVANESKNNVATTTTKEDKGATTTTTEENQEESKSAPNVEDDKPKETAAAPALVKEEEMTTTTPEATTTTETLPPTPTAPMEDDADDIVGVQNDEQEDVTPEQVVPQNAENPYEVDISWLTDPVLNVAIVLMAAICYLLARKSSELLGELQSLNAQIAL